MLINYLIKEFKLLDKITLLNFYKFLAKWKTKLSKRLHPTKRHA
jgi:hypothetical protein